MTSWKNKKYKKKAEEEDEEEEEEEIRRKEKKKRRRGKKKKKKKKKKTVFSRDFGPVRFLHLRFSYVFQHFKVPVPKWCPKRPGIWDQGPETQ